VTEYETQSEHWNGPNGETWARESCATDPRLEHFGQAAIATLAPRRGERVLDVGCGAGATSRALARLVEPRGHVVGVDISRPLLAVARSLGGGVEYVEADAGRAGLEGAFDAVFSRFGVMFFDDPRTAFANLRRAAPRGRLVFVCWRSPQENPAMTRPLALAKHLLPESAPFDPEAPGPFAFADRNKIENVLRAAGWHGIEVVGHDSSYLLGESPQAATDYVMTIGPLARAIREAPERTSKVRALLETTFASEASGGVVSAAAATWIVSASA